MLLGEIAKGNNTAAFDLEWPMQALVSLAEPADEEWILARLDDMKFDGGFDFPQLSRAAECLAYSGSAKSLTYRKQIAAQLKDKELMLNVCQVAFEQICRREKIPFIKGDLFQA
jgi:hypothetical protein